MFEDSPHTAAALAQKRIHFLFNMSMAGYDLLVNKGQNELRFICPTALATKRPSSHLFTDTVHKAISNVLLVTLGYEMPFYTGKQVSVVEIAPGIVDTGMYDRLSVREYTAQEGVLDGFPMDGAVDVKNAHTWPMLSIEHLAQVVQAYLVADMGDDIAHQVDPRALGLTLAGRKKNALLRNFKESLGVEGDKIVLKKNLPEYCYTANTVWNGFPKMRTGYIPVMLTPAGQYF